MKKIRMIELFAGIGACSKALETSGIDLEIVDAVEIDKYAIKSFNAIHKTNFEVQDIKQWDKDLKDIDIITHGSPCQDISIAGKQKGADVGSGTRSSLMYETIRIVGKIRPKYVLWENVKNLLSKKHKHNFDNYIETMNILGYNSYYAVLDAKDYGIPQHRERVYTVSIRKDIDKENFKFPEKEELKLRLKDMLEDNVDEKYYLSDEITNKYIPVNEKRNVIGKLNINKWQDNMKRIYDINKYSPSINTMQGGNLQPKIIKKVNRIYDEQGLASTLTQQEEKILTEKLPGAYGRDFGSKGKIQDIERECDTLQSAMGCGGGNVPIIEIKNATKKGYDEAKEGDSINLSYPESTTRRGRVGHGISQTLQCNDNMGVVEKTKID